MQTRTHTPCSSIGHHSSNRTTHSTHCGYCFVSAGNILNCTMSMSSIYLWTLRNYESHNFMLFSFVLWWNQPRILSISGICLHSIVVGLHATHNWLCRTRINCRPWLAGTPMSTVGNFRRTHHNLSKTGECSTYQMAHIPKSMRRTEVQPCQ